MSTLYRLYDRNSGDAFAPDGYPVVWHDEVKDAVRALWGNRCVRCKHPYTKGAHPLIEEVDLVGNIGWTSWSSCDTLCTHRGPIRVRRSDGDDDIWFEEAEAFTPPGHMVSDGLLVEAKWRILTVHHLDGIKGNLCWWNLVPLCQRCHLRIQQKVQMARVWPWEHSDWFQPFVAGYYAYVYLGEQLSLKEVRRRLDELLYLERMA